jgi:hypothetical protein
MWCTWRALRPAGPSSIEAIARTRWLAALFGPNWRPFSASESGVSSAPRDELGVCLDVCERGECITMGARPLQAIGEVSRHCSACSPSLAGLLTTRKARRFPPASGRAAKTSPPRRAPMNRPRSMMTPATPAPRFRPAIAPNVPLFPPRTTRSSAAARSRAAPLLSKKRSSASAPWRGPSRPRWSDTWVAAAWWWCSTTTASRDLRGPFSRRASRATQRRPLRV